MSRGGRLTRSIERNDLPPANIITLYPPYFNFLLRLFETLQISKLNQIITLKFTKIEKNELYSCLLKEKYESWNPGTDSKVKILKFWLRWHENFVSDLWKTPSKAEIVDVLVAGYS